MCLLLVSDRVKDRGVELLAVYHVPQLDGCLPDSIIGGQ